MRVLRHKLAEDPRLEPYRRSVNIDEAMSPDLVVLHDTAGRLEDGNSAHYLATSRRVSVHLVIERDGSIRQLAPFDRACDHAGPSHYHGRNDVNGFSIGIEMVNPGRMTLGGRGRARAWWGETFDLDEYDIDLITTPEHGRGYWMPHTEAQLAATLDVLDALFAGIDSLRDVRTHWYISPGRKVDTNPHLQIESIRARVLGRTEPTDIEAEEQSDPLDRGQFVEIDTRGSNLNQRRWPSFNPNVVGSIPDGTIVPVIRSGTFGGRDWSLVQYGGREGWVVDAYTAPVTQA
ncbi:MAG: N-acetylmuramoyl-L-alanine amidase [Paracoccaceae bacterium]